MLGSWLGKIYSFISNFRNRSRNGSLQRFRQFDSALRLISFSTLETASQGSHDGHVEMKQRALGATLDIQQWK
jgi:hypothetical protein